MRVAIERITGRRNGATDPANVRRLRAALRRREKLPPLQVARIGSRLELLDGFHRLRACRAEGRKTVVVQVVIES
jgi:ParB-like chromosome segregation protein Spo0J